MLMKANKEKQDKLTEKAFAQSLAVSVIGILLCVVALCSTTWAWFSGSVSSNANTIQAANCDMTVSVQNIDDTTPVEIDATDGKYSLSANATYKITLKAVGTAETAYATVEIQEDTYYTKQFNVAATEADAAEFTFELRFSQDETTIIEIIPHWGTSSQTERKFENGKKYLNLELFEEFSQNAQTEQPATQPMETTSPTETTVPAERTEPADTTESVEQVQGE